MNITIETIKSQEDSLAVKLFEKGIVARSVQPYFEIGRTLDVEVSYKAKNLFRSKIKDIGYKIIDCIECEIVNSIIFTVERI